MPTVAEDRNTSMLVMDDDEDTIQSTKLLFELPGVNRRLRTIGEETVDLIESPIRWLLAVRHSCHTLLRSTRPSERVSCQRHGASIDSAEF